MDPVVKSHFQSLYDGMLEKNLCRIIEPYSRVEMAHVAKCIQLPHVCYKIFSETSSEAIHFLFISEPSREKIVADDFG